MINIKPTTRALLALAFCITLSFTGSAYAWEIAKQEDGITIFTALPDGSNFKAFKGEMHINAKLGHALQIIQDVESMDEWLHECVKSELLETQADNEIIVYQETNAPWPVTNRNFILTMRTQQQSDTSASITFNALVEPDVPDDECVRVTELSGSWHLKQTTPELLAIIYQTQADPAGDIPAWLANAFVVDQPFMTLKNLRARILDLE